MKRQIFAAKPIRALDWILTLLPFLIWFGEVQSRSLVMDTYCAKTPEACVAARMLPVDRISLGLENSSADGYSYFTQNLTGALAGATMIAWNVAAGGPVWLNVATDGVILLQTAGWNGLATELSHLVSQRPRPFVYQDPKVRGSEAAHYTSFYSGHTSFVAAMVFGLLLCLLRRRAPAWLLLSCAAGGQCLLLSTAIFRVFAGRHFPTDVICGAIAGGLVAFAVVVRRAAD